MINTLHKSLTIAFLAASIFISGLSVDFVGAQNAAVDTAASLRPADLLLSPYIRFGRFTSKDGLSSDQVFDITQDNHGFMWFGTTDGLNRYDGIGVKVYRRDLNDPHSLSQSIVRSLGVDQSGNLWVGTWGGGLNRYDREKDAFIRYQHDPDDPHSLSNNIIRAVYADRAGTIWAGTMGGLNKLDRESKQFTRYQHDPDEPNSLSNDIVWSVFEDSTGLLWVGTEGGLDRFDPKTEQFTHFRHNPDDPFSLSHNTVRSIYEDSSGILWVGTTKGLCKFNPERTRFTCYQHDPDDPQTLSNNIVSAVHVDRAGKLWVGTWGGGGLNRFDRETATFAHYRPDPLDPYSLSGGGRVDKIYEGRDGILWIATEGGISFLDNGAKPFHHYRVISDNPDSLSNNVVRALHAGRSGVVWVGTNGGGLSKFDRQTEKFTHYQRDPADPNSIASDSVWAIYEDHMGLIWIGSHGNGLSKFDPDTERFTTYRYDDANPHSLSHDNIMSIYEDPTGNLWISTWGGGLNKFDRDTEQFIRYQHDPANPHTLSNNAVSSVLEDRVGVLWIGTMKGLNKFDRETETFTHYRHISTDPQSLAQDSVTSLYEDRTGTLWIGTSGGVDKFDRHNDQFSHYSATANGLSNDSIWGILEDEQGRLWLSTSNGLSRFDPRTESFRNYNVSDGLQSNTFLMYSAYSKSRSGEMYFGGSNGFNAFYPDQIVDNPTPPPVMITDFQLANKPVPIGADSVLQKSILETNNLVLSYRDRVFSFEFAALNFRAAEKNRYKYRMEGFEEAWNEVDSTRRFATYTNLDPGDYLFKVIASNNDGIWNEEGASIRLTVIPPWWQTMWFRISMVVVAIGLLGGGFRWRVSAIEARSRALEIEVQRMTQIRQAERALQKSRQNFQLLFERHHAVMLLIDPDSGKIVDANRAAATFYGYSRAELRAMNIAAINQLNPEQIADKLQNAKTGTGNYFIFPHRLANGEIRTVEVYSTLIDFQDRTLLFSIIHDITKRKQAERALQESEDKFRTLVTNTEEIVYMVDKNGRFLLSEGKGLAKLGLKPGQIVGKSVFELYKDYPQMLAEMRQAFNGETVANEVNVDGNYFRNWYTPHKNHAGEIIGLLGLSVNITEQKQAEQRFKSYQQRLKALASQLTITEEKERRRIAADLHDHVGQSLALARIQIASVRKHASDPGQTATLDEISDALRHTVQETRDLIYDLSPPQLNEIGLSAAISEWLEEQVEKKYALKTKCVVSGAEGPMDDDVRVILFRSVRELVTNVIKHARATRVNIRVNQDHDRVKVIIRDDGAGFDADAESQSLKAEGGFGIFSIKERMADLGGSLEIISEPGQGTEAILAVPLEKEEGKSECGMF